MIQARPLDNSFGDPVGTFSVDSADNKSQAMQCSAPAVSETGRFLCAQFRVQEFSDMLTYHAMYNIYL